MMNWVDKKIMNEQQQSRVKHACNPTNSHSRPELQISRHGEMFKSPLDMSPEEYANWKIEIQTDARKYLFSIGQPYVTRQGGRIVAEFADGRVDFF